MSTHFARYLFSALLIAALSACGGSDDSPSPTSPTASSMTMTHWGVDFSAGYSPSDVNDTPIDWADQDGYTVTWSDTGYVTGEAYGSGIWFSNSGNVTDPAGLVVYIEDLGDVALSSVTSVPGNWHSVADPMPALQVDHVYVVKTQDGYAKFKVQSMDTAAMDWPVTVTYQFSSSTSF